MTAKDLLAQTQKFFVESNLGANKSIKYGYQDGTVLEEIKVFANELDLNTIKSDKNEAKAILSNVFLPQEPKQNDRIKFHGDSDIWRVQTWRKQDGAYILDITSKRYKV